MEGTAAVFAAAAAIVVVVVVVVVDFVVVVVLCVDGSKDNITECTVVSIRDNSYILIYSLSSSNNDRYTYR